MKGFLDQLHVAPQPDGTWIVTQPFRWENGRVHTVPALFVTDFASVPRVVPTLLAAVLGVVLAALFGGGTLATWGGAIAAGVLVSWFGLSPYGRHQWAAVVHDYAYWSHEVSRAEADRAFLDGMRDAGVWLTRRWAMYAAVRIFGGFAWWTNERMRAAGVNRVLERMPNKWTTLPPVGIERLVLVVLGRA